MTESTRPKRRVGTIRYVEARGRYEIRLRERPGAEPKSTFLRHDKNATGDRLAEEELASRIAALSKGVKHTPRTYTVGTWLDRWLESQAGLRPATQRAYAARIDLYLKPVLGKHRLAALEPHDVSVAMAKLGRMKSERRDSLSVGTVDAAHRVLSAALQAAWMQGKAPYNAARQALVKRPDTRIEPPTQAELDEIMAELTGHPWYPVFLTLRWTGARLGEVLGLEARRPFLDLDARLARVSRQREGTALKTNASRRPLLLPPLLVTELRKIPPRIDSPYLFTTASGAPIHGSNVLKVFNRACDVRGIRPSEHADRVKYRLHDFRHAFATLLLEASVPATTVQAMLGWGSLSQLDTYSHVVPRPGGDSFQRVVDAFGDDIDALLPHHARLSAAR